MRIGIAIPTTEIGADPAVIRDFIETAEGAGYDHLTCLDHVVAPGTAQGPGEAAYYVRANTFHEPLSLFAFAAGLTRRIELATAVLVLPQRQTALVAKQAAEIDVLSGGRLRLGVGLGWLQPEYRALGAEFRTRARRFEEQVALLRRLWTEELVTFEGAFHRLDDVGLNPLPPRGTIPLWIGAFQIPAIERAGRVRIAVRIRDIIVRGRDHAVVASAPFSLMEYQSVAPRCAGTTPRPGLMPTRPVQAAGMRTLPMPSLP